MVERAQSLCGYAWSATKKFWGGSRAESRV